MIQLLGIRSFQKEGKEKKYDAFFDRGWRADSVQDLFENLDQHLAQIPLEEKWNLYFTPANCTDKKRDFQSSSILSFDIDHVDTERLSNYVRVFCTQLNLSDKQTGILFSGHGLQFFVGLLVPIVTKDFYDTYRDHYKAICTQLARALQAENLPGDMDTSVFDARRMMRLPGTINRKPGLPDAHARLIQAKIVPVNFDITLASGIPTVKKEDQLDNASLKKFGKADNTAIMKGCGFLRHARDYPAALSEPQWYAALSITARMEDGYKVSHEISKAHPSYSEAETDTKIEQALSASGPRTCKSIYNVWEGCKTCPNFQGKDVVSPILLRSADSIKTEHTGFHDMVFDPETNKAKRGKPNYEDLRKYFERENWYRSEGKVCWSYNGKFYEEYGHERLEHYAQEKFDPVAVTAMTQEFKNLVHRTNLATPPFWAETTRRKVNFQNGVLDLDTLELVPHSKDYGFRYALSYNYEPGAVARTFEKFLADVTGESVELQNILLEFLGYALSGDLLFAENFLLLSGVGQNGKSTFMRVIEAVLGKPNCSHIPYKKLSEDYYKVQLQQTLVNISEEVPGRNARDMTDLKMLTTTGATIMARPPYKAPVSFIMRTKLIFLCNDMPTSYDTSDGFFRRFLIVPFNQKFTDANGKKDVKIFEKMAAELPGIFNLAAAAYKRLIANSYRFTQSRESSEELDEYKTLTDSMTAWMHDCVLLTDPNGPDFLPISELYRSYADYFERSGYQKQEQLNLSVFGKKLSKLIPDYETRNNHGKQKKINGTRYKVLYGIKVGEIKENGFGV